LSTKTLLLIEIKNLLGSGSVHFYLWSSRKPHLRVVLPWELFYAYDLVVIAELKGLTSGRIMWRIEHESKYE